MFVVLSLTAAGMKRSGFRSCFTIHRYKICCGLERPKTPATAMFYTRCWALVFLIFQYLLSLYNETIIKSGNASENICITTFYFVSIESIPK